MLRVLKVLRVLRVLRVYGFEGLGLRCEKQTDS